MNLWLVVVGMGIITYLLRLAWVAASDRIEMPPLLNTALQYVPPAVLAAIIFPEVLMPSGQFDLSFTNPRLLAGLVAAAVAYRTRNVLATIIAGMSILWLLQWLLALPAS